MKRIRFIVTILLVSFLASPAVFAEKPPKDARPLSEILGIVESQGYTPVLEVEFERGVWEIEAIRADSRRELRVDPYTGTVLADRPND